MSTEQKQKKTDSLEELYQEFRKAAGGIVEASFLREAAKKLYRIVGTRIGKDFVLWAYGIYTENQDKNKNMYSSNFGKGGSHPSFRFVADYYLWLRKREKDKELMRARRYIARALDKVIEKDDIGRYRYYLLLVKDPYRTIAQLVERIYITLGLGNVRVESVEIGKDETSIRLSDGRTLVFENSLFSYRSNILLKILEDYEYTVVEPVPGRLVVSREGQNPIIITRYGEPERIIAPRKLSHVRGELSLLFYHSDLKRFVEDPVFNPVWEQVKDWPGTAKYSVAQVLGETEIDGRKAYRIVSRTTSEEYIALPLEKTMILLPADERVAVKLLRAMRMEKLEVSMPSTDYIEEYVDNDEKEGPFILAYTKRPLRVTFSYNMLVPDLSGYPIFKILDRSEMAKETAYTRIVSSYARFDSIVELAYYGRIYGFYDSQKRRTLFWSPIDQVVSVPLRSRDSKEKIRYLMAYGTAIVATYNRGARKTTYYGLNKVPPVILLA